MQMFEVTTDSWKWFLRLQTYLNLNNNLRVYLLHSLRVVVEVACEFAAPSGD